MTTSPGLTYIRYLILTKTSTHVGIRWVYGPLFTRHNTPVISMPVSFSVIKSARIVNRWMKIIIYKIVIIYIEVMTYKIVITYSITKLPVLSVLCKNYYHYLAIWSLSLDGRSAVDSCLAVRWFHPFNSSQIHDITHRWCINN